MSTKQFISAEAHLNKLGITEQQALNLIVEYLDRPDVIYTAARQNGITNAMLSEITQVPIDTITQYFAIAGFDSIELDYTSLLINFDLGDFEDLVGFNENSGVLSNAALSEAVRPLLNTPVTYDFTFSPIYDHIQPIDGIYDAEELGVGHLSDVPATDESVESLFYGSLINMFSVLDTTELNEIKTFPKDTDPDGFQALLTDTLEDNSIPVERTDQQLFDLVTNEAADIIDLFWENDFVGVLDHSYLGVAVA